MAAMTQVQAKPSWWSGCGGRRGPDEEMHEARAAQPPNPLIVLLELALTYLVVWGPDETRAAHAPPAVERAREAVGGVDASQHAALPLAALLGAWGVGHER
jgi:hypothetical protein